MKDLFQPGNTLKVIAVNHGHRAGKMLVDMGVTPGTVISVIRRAPFGEPLVVRVRSYTLALRRKDLEALTVEPVRGVCREAV